MSIPPDRPRIRGAGNLQNDTAREGTPMAGLEDTVGGTEAVLVETEQNYMLIWIFRFKFDSSFQIENYSF